jgi:hypothetical protein
MKGVKWWRSRYTVRKSLADPPIKESPENDQETISAGASYQPADSVLFRASVSFQASEESCAIS